jgi:hypothetical protein
MPCFSSCGDNKPSDAKVNQVAEGVVTNNDISVLSAASGVIAINVNGLLAQRAGDLLIQHRNTETVSDGCTEDSWLQKGVTSIFLGRDGSNEPVGVWLGAAPEALCLTLVRRRANQKGVPFLVEIEARYRLGHVFCRHPRWGYPRLFGSLHRFMPTCMVSHVRVFGDPTEAETPQLGSEADLHERYIVHREPQDALNGLLDHQIEFRGLMFPQVQRSCSHEVDSRPRKMDVTPF